MMPCPMKIWWVVSCPIWTLIFDSWILCWLVPWAYLPGPLKSCWHLYFFWALSGDTRIIPPFSCIVSEVGVVYWIHCPTTPTVRTLSRKIHWLSLILGLTHFFLWHWLRGRQVSETLYLGPIFIHIVINPPSLPPCLSFTLCLSPPFAYRIF